MLENVRKRRRIVPKRQRFANLESEDLNSLLDTAQAQSIEYNTAYVVILILNNILSMKIIIKNFSMVLYQLRMVYLYKRLLTI